MCYTVKDMASSEKYESFSFSFIKIIRKNLAFNSWCPLLESCLEMLYHFLKLIICLYYVYLVFSSFYCSLGNICLMSVFAMVVSRFLFFSPQESADFCFLSCLLHSVVQFILGLLTK